MNTRWVIGAAAGGLLAAAFLPMAVAFADEIGITPDEGTFDPTQVTGMPPTSAEVLMGQEEWSTFDFTTGNSVFGDGGQNFFGVDTETVMGSMTNNLFSTHGLSVDLLNTGGGWGYEWVDIPATTPGESASEAFLFITPFEDFVTGNLDLSTFF